MTQLSTAYVSYHYAPASIGKGELSVAVRRNYQICRLLLLTDVIHYLDTSVAYRRTHLLRRHFNCQ